MGRWSRWGIIPHLLILTTLAALFVGLTRQLQLQPRRDASLEMQVALPRSLQVVMSGGDRYLAANIAVFRALVVSTERMRPEDYPVLGKVQGDASWLNPAHEDNYYIAAAILPWNGEYEAAQLILARAAASRPFDYQPAFYQAFDLYHFRKDPLGAAQLLRKAAVSSTSLQSRFVLESMAARWVEKADDLAVSVDVIRSMMEASRYSGMRDYLAQRLQRLETLLVLRQAADLYEQKVGHRTLSIDDLVGAGLIARLPVDPFGQVYTMTPQGVPILSDKSRP